MDQFAGGVDAGIIEGILGETSEVLGGASLGAVGILSTLLSKDSSDDEAIVFYRAVGRAEQIQLDATGRFEPSPGGLESKYFGLSYSNVLDYAHQFNGSPTSAATTDPYVAIYQTTFPKGVLTPDMIWPVDRGIIAVLIPNEKLYLLSRATPFGPVPK